ncbi:1,3-beta-glucan synthase component-domain-containing protein [Cunninghamella echinulata]|nr:1,3-beta-glucan synthase component-domain-containing protein [Cunninghamella echinulata]
MENSNNKENILIDENIITDETTSSLLFISNNDHPSHSTILEEKTIKQHSSHLQQQRRKLYQQYQPHLFYQDQQDYYNNNSLPNSIVDSVQEYDDVSESSSMFVNYHVNNNNTTNILKNKNSNAFTTACANINASDNNNQHISTSMNDVDIYGHVYEEISHAGRYLKCAPSTESLLALLDVKQKNKKKYYNSSTLSLQQQQQQQQSNHYKKSPSLPNFDTPSTSSSPLVTEQRYFPYNRHQDNADNEDQNDDMKKIHEEDHHDEYLEKYPTWYQASLLERKKKHFESHGKIPTPNMIRHLLKRFKNCFGFQQDSINNMFDHILTLLDSRRSRMETCEWAIKTLHAEYIGGPHANYKKWYFACQFYKFEYPDIEDIELKWQRMMEQKTNMERMQDISLWLLIWSEMSVLRFCPELLCFIFKLANDFYSYYELQYMDSNNDHHQDPLLSKIAEEGDFLNYIVTPLYQYVYEQGWRQDQRRRERDHDKIIGYDDINQYFWSFKNLSTLSYSLSDVAINQEKGKKSKKKKKKNRDQELVMQLEAHQRYNAFKYIEWNDIFKKTFKEKRSWLHLAVNFTRIWLLHIVSFWFFIIPNATALYIDSSSVDTSLDNVVPLKARGEASNLENEVANITDLQHYMDMVTSKEIAVVLSMTALGGGLATLIMIFGPSVYCLKIQRHGQLSQIIAVIQLIISVITTLYFILKTPSSASGSSEDHKSFVAHFPSLSKKDRYISIGLWGCVFGCKLIESYFFLALSFKDPLASILTMSIKECPNTDGGGTISILLHVICQSMPRIISIIMILTELVLFFLDTYLWYVIWNTIFSVIQSFYLGISILTPWRNVFARLPKRIYTKILSSTYSDENQYANPKLLCSQIWNSFILTMYREHLLSSDHVTKLLYQQSPAMHDGKTILKAPSFFVSQEDSAYETEYYPPESEAERRLQFLATSLSSPMPEALPVPQMPTFTVMTPHYNEKILLDLREIIKQDDQHTKLTLLEYLQHLHPFEWENFVNDTKLMASSKLHDNGDDTDDENNSFFRKMKSTRISEEEQDMADTSSTTSSFTARNDVDDDMDDEGIVKSSTMKQHSKKFNKLDDLPFYCIGFKDPTPEYTLRTRIWASLRSQTLYRTITGFMNYHKAIKLLYRVENPEGIQMQQQYQRQHTSVTLDQMANRKFKFLIAMQRYMEFTHEENENVEFIFKSYPNLQVAYIENNINEGKYYSCLIDGYCPLNEFGKRQPKYRIQLPGNPILGDGKSDNQNTAIIYYRGEFLQLIDANQDNYLEECLKIRSVLGEFEGSMSPSSSSQQLQEYSPYDQELLTQSSSPVAIVGAREYIFSERTGVLGDVAAGKEQTFGTLTQRVMATIGGRLHYGHPDFLNAIFMTTRGGVSKAQKGLHLNEDIYAGMNAFQRGGRIKHVDYYQCAKGRDLGFQSILNFVTKIGSGMGEQMLSREYYHLGTNLPLDRFLTFYYAHPGFHINNVFIMLAIQLFLLVILLLSAIRIPSLLDVNSLCDNSSEAINNSECTSAMDHHLIPVFHWIKRVVLSIFVVLLVSFMPLFMHELTEHGFWRALSRLFKHFTSMSPMFEIFVTQVYSRSILQNLSFGGAKYISTGRGFAITRQSFSSLYMRFADISLYLGIQHFMILLFASMIVWMPHLVYFWFTVCALILSPFLFNPHQFSLVDFLVDYKDLLHWFSTGNNNSNDKNCNNSWIGFYRTYRMQLTGIKRNQNTSPKLYQPRPKLKVVLFSEIILPFIYALFCMVAYIFIHPTARYGGLLRLGALALAPIGINAIILLPLFFVSLLFGSLHGLIFGAESKLRIGSIIAIIAHTLSIMFTIGCFAFIYFLEHWKLPQVLLAIVAISSIQRFIFKSITLCLTREFYHDQSHLAWWTGKWLGRKLGWYVLTQPFREYICKIIEMGQFSIDFIIIHMILLVLFLICLIPNVDQYHSWILFWTKKPKKTFIYNSKKQKKKQQHTVITSTINYGSFYTIRQKKTRRRVAFIYGFLFVCIVTFMLVLFIAPSYLGPTYFKPLDSLFKSIPI